MPVIGARLAVDAVHSFLTTSADPVQSFNDLLSVYRTQESLTAAQFPDVVTFGKYVYLGSQQAASGPYLAIEWESSEPETENNSRLVPHRMALYLLLQDRDVSGDEETMFRRALDYDAVLRAMFLRSTYAAGIGYTLNNGGSGLTTEGRILRATIDGASLQIDTELNTANALMRWALSVTVIEDYPG